MGVIYYIRHGESQANVDGVFVGPNTPTPLTDRGRQQSKEAGMKLKESGLLIDHIVSSTLVRAKDTAEIIAGIIGYDITKIQYDARLAEYDVGAANYYLIANLTTATLLKMSGQENPIAFQKRIMDAINEIKQIPGNTLIVAHDGVGRMIEATMLQLSPELFLDMKPYLNAQIVRLEI
jgi:probable phosphoglycerate mutase